MRSRSPCRRLRTRTVIAANRHRKSRSRLATSVCANGGSTTCSWSSTRCEWASARVKREVPELNLMIGPARLDHLPCGGGALQDATRRIPQDWTGVGDLGRPRHALTSQGRSKGSIPALPRYPALLFKAMVQAARYVCRRGRYSALASGRGPRSCVPMGRIR